PAAGRGRRGRGRRGPRRRLDRPRPSRAGVADPLHPRRRRASLAVGLHARRAGAAGGPGQGRRRARRARGPGAEGAGGMSDVAVLIPTLRRPDSLARAVASVLAQQGVADRLAEVVVIDNDPDGSARDTVAAAAAGAPVPVRYVHAPRPGVATARNAGLAATDAPLIAFLDDDEAATPGWLAALLKARATTGADAVFGPITGRAPDAAPWLKPWLERFFGREGPAQTGLIAQPFGCGNSLMVRSTALPGPAPFDAGTDQAGGEDDALFAALAARGG